jgi:hypothetical protein
MKLAALSFALAILLAAPVASADPELQPKLAEIGFLVGDWSNGQGRVADGGGASTGASMVTVEAGGGVLLRRDHTSLFDRNGKPAGGFNQVMIIYPEAGTLHADYSDGAHVIHYVTAEVQPGRSVTFTSAIRPGAPVFRLAYELTAPDALIVTFGMIPPGGVFQPIAVGTLRRGG